MVESLMLWAWDSGALAVGKAREMGLRGEDGPGGRDLRTPTLQSQVGCQDQVVLVGVGSRKWEVSS